MNDETKTVIWLVWSVSFVWLNETNQMNQINQINKTNQINQTNFTEEDDLSPPLFDHDDGLHVMTWHVAQV